jgi:acetyl-CoA C-acetyltransferase
MSVHVAATGRSRFGKREEGLLELLTEAGKDALRGAPASAARPEALFVGSMAPGPLCGLENLVPKVADALELSGIPGLHVDAASASGAGVLHAAAAAVAAGIYRSALVVAGEKMTAVPLTDVTTVLSHSLSPLEVLHGATMPSMAALVSQAYLDHFHLPIDEVGIVTVANRAAASRNPFAHFQKPVTLEEVNGSRIISSPLRLLHVSPVSDGAAAVLLTRDRTGVEVVGLGQGTDRTDVILREGLTGFLATRLAAKAAYEMAHLTRKEVSVAEVHDAFAPFELIDLEDVGICGPGESLRWLRDGNGAPSGPVAVNPSGGILGRGHPVGASGLIQIVEISRQLEGTAGPLQAGTRRVGLAQSVGGMGSHNFVTLLSRV